MLIFLRALVVRMSLYQKKPKAKHPNGYSGVLLEPLHLPQRTVLSEASGQHASLEAENLKKYGDRIVALFAHYDINPSASEAGFRLALKLAHDHVPGFQFVSPSSPRRGAPNKWQAGKGVSLYLDVSETIKTKRCSIAVACRHLAGRGLYKSDNASNLIRRYKEIKKDSGFIRLIEFAENRGAPLPKDFLTQLRGVYFGAPMKGGK